MTQNTVQWSNPSDPNNWSLQLATVETTTCLNRFEVLISGSELDSELVRKWAHEQLDAWLDKR